MSSLVVVASPAVADGFRLAGCETHAVEPGERAAALVRALVERPDVGLLLVTADCWMAVPEGLRGALEQRDLPVVLPVPAGAAEGAPSREQLLTEMLARAIGFRIRLTTGGAAE
jgi:vacuolar-type H+-ATPase subunit F/Vma7